MQARYAIWHTVKALDQQYMEAQLARAGTPSPQVIGIDEIAIRKGHTYRIVVSDLLRGRPIWFGGKDPADQTHETGKFAATRCIGMTSIRLVADSVPGWTSQSQTCTRGRTQIPLQSSHTGAPRVQ